jgi:hypothetical protein
MITSNLTDYFSLKLPNIGYNVYEFDFADVKLFRFI